MPYKFTVAGFLLAVDKFAHDDFGNNRLKHLCMVYGLDYFASEKVYNSSVLKLTDPLEITHAKFVACKIENPWRAFNYVYKRNCHAEFNFMRIINA